MSAARIALVGCGRLAEAGYLPAAKLASEATIAALADPDRARREELAAAAGCPAYPDLGALLEAEEIDGVVVASPPATHVDVALEAAEAGIRALVEKPPAPDLPGAERLAAVDPAPYVGFNRRFSLGAGAKGKLEDGGRIEAELRYRRFSWAPVSVRDPALLDLAPHLIDLALRAGLGEPREVEAESKRPERLGLELRAENGSAHISCACDRFHRERFRVENPDGAAFDRKEGGPVRSVRERLRSGPHPLVASLRAQLEEFAAALGGGSPQALATAEDGVRTMRVVAAASASLARGGAVGMGEVASA